jgi:adenine nucleotide transporter 17
MLTSSPVIKSRQQSGSHSKGNVWTAMTDIIEREGVSGLYRGISSKLLQSVATAGILFASKEQVFRAVSALLASRRAAADAAAKAAVSAAGQAAKAVK